MTVRDSGATIPEPSPICASQRKGMLGDGNARAQLAHPYALHKVSKFRAGSARALVAAFHFVPAVAAALSRSGLNDRLDGNHVNLLADLDQSLPS
jgi:hypothetical protein